MTLFAKLRESVALFICPELRAKPQRAGYNGTAKPLERAALDAAYAARTPEERGFISAEEAQAHDRARKEWIESEKSRLKELGEDGQPSPAAKEATLHQAGSPKWHVYQVAIPREWTALRPVFYPVPGGNDQSEPQDTLAVLQAGWRRFQAGVLLCRRGADDRAAVREFASCASLEAAFLGQDGQYLQAAQERPAFAVVPLEGPSSSTTDQGQFDECLVLLPLIDPSSFAPRDSTPALMMFVNGMRVEWGKR